MLIQKILISFFILWIGNISSSFADTYYNFRYQVQEGDTFSSILKKFVAPDSIINLRTPMILKMKKMNPTVTNWNKLTAGIELQMYISKPFFEINKYAEYSQKNPINNNAQNKIEVLTPKETPIETPKETTNNRAKGFRASLFYMSSLGLFTQKSAAYGDIALYQNSPITLGMTGNFYSRDSLFSTSLSSYVSYLVASTNNVGVDEMKVAPEIGFNAFEEYRYNKWNTLLYTGPDYEKFTIVNVGALGRKSKDYTDETSILYLTIGFSKQFTFFDRKWFTKISLSQSVLSSTKSNSVEDTGPYSAQKFLLYLNYKLSEKFYLHTLIKYHIMKGPSDISTLRLGIGVGYILF